MTKDIFSPKEKALIKAFGDRKEATITQLNRKLYGKKATGDTANIVAGVVRRITRKCLDANHEWFFLGSGIGRAGKTIWKERAVRDRKKVRKSGVKRGNTK